MNKSEKTKSKRLDLILVEKNLAESREKAQALILAGRVFVNGQKITKSGTFFKEVEITIKKTLPFVSKGGVKLDAAINKFDVEIKGKTSLDIGSSTGGFIDCLLKRGVKKAYGVDVGKNQLHYSLQKNPKVINFEGINAKNPFFLPEAVDIITVDVSFISITKVLISSSFHLKAGGVLICLIKPQFEAEKNEITQKGTPKNAKIVAKSLEKVTRWLLENKFSLIKTMPAPITGTAKNQEFFFLIQKPT